MLSRLINGSNMIDRRELSVVFHFIRILYKLDAIDYKEYEKCYNNLNKSFSIGLMG